MFNESTFRDTSPIITKVVGSFNILVHEMIHLYTLLYACSPQLFLISTTSNKKGVLYTIIFINKFALYNEVMSTGKYI